MSFSLQDLGLVDSPAERAFDNITELAAAFLEASISLVSIVEPDKDRQFFKSHIGLAEPWASRRQTPLSHSFCQHAVKRNQPLIVDNAPEHELVSANLAIAELGIIAYLGVPVHDTNGSPIGALCVIEGEPRNWTEQDVSHLRKLAACVSDQIALKAALLTSEQLRAEQREFSYSISHDLKAPINTLQLINNEIVHELGDGGEVALELMTLSGKTIGRMNDLVANILEYIKTLGESTNMETVDLGELIHDVLIDLRGNIKEVGAQIVAGALPKIEADRLQCRILIQNLLSNAIKFRRNDETPRIEITGIDSADGKRGFAISDNGIGIARCDQEQIFDVFKKLHTRETYPGTGIGLALCRRVVFNHGGRIELKSFEGEGSCFSVYFPK